MGGWLDVDVLVEQLELDMKGSGRGGYRPDEVPGLVRAAVERLMARREGDAVTEPRCPYVDHFPIHPQLTSAVAGEAPRRGVRERSR